VRSPIIRDNQQFMDMESYEDLIQILSAQVKRLAETRVAHEDRSLNHSLCGRGKRNRGIAKPFATAPSAAKNVVEDLATLDQIGSLGGRMEPKFSVPENSQSRRAALVDSAIT
jgi:hypothetical protein